MLPASLIDTALELLGEAGKRSRLRIAGNSMSPLIGDGYDLIVEHKGGIGLGDIVIFKHQGRVMAHRVVRVLQNKDRAVFVTKGDNSTGFDSPISREQIIGKVVMILNL